MVFIVTPVLSGDIHSLGSKMSTSVWVQHVCTTGSPMSHRVNCLQTLSSALAGSKLRERSMVGGLGELRSVSAGGNNLFPSSCMYIKRRDSGAK